MKSSSAILGRALGQTEYIKRLINPYFPTALGLTFQLRTAYRPVRKVAALVIYRRVCLFLPSPGSPASPGKGSGRGGGSHHWLGDITEKTTTGDRGLRTPRVSSWQHRRVPGRLPAHQEAFCPEPGLTIWMPSQQQLFPPLCTQPPPAHPSLSPSSHATIFLLLASSAHNLQPPIKRIEKPSSCPRAATVNAF